MLEYFYNSILLYYFILLEIEKGRKMKKEEKKQITSKEIQNDRSLENRTIDYLKKNSNALIIEGFNYLIKSDEDNDELYDFQNNKDLQEQFKLSINEHFNWIMAHCDNKYSNEARFINYKNSDIKLFDVYCLFYNFLINESSIEIKPPNLKKALKGYFTHLKAKIYCYEE